MLINLRNALMAGKRLPYDAEVEYLESTGTQYINTGVGYYADFEILCQGHPSTYSYNRLLGTTSSRSVRAISSSNNCWVFYPGTVISTAACGGTHLISWRDGIISIDGTVISTNPKDSGSGDFLLFATATTTLGRVKIFSCKLYDENGVLVRDFIPVRKGTVGYLYDRVSGKLFGNAGTGDFVLGQDKN